MLRELIGPQGSYRHSWWWAMAMGVSYGLLPQQIKIWWIDICLDFGLARACFSSERMHSHRDCMLNIACSRGSTICIKSNIVDSGWPAIAGAQTESSLQHPSVSSQQLHVTSWTGVVSCVLGYNQPPHGLVKHFRYVYGRPLTELFSAFEAELLCSLGTFLKAALYLTSEFDWIVEFHALQQKRAHGTRSPIQLEYQSLRLLLDWCLASLDSQQQPTIHRLQEACIATRKREEWGGEWGGGIIGIEDNDP